MFFYQKWIYLLRIWFYFLVKAQTWSCVSCSVDLCPSSSMSCFRDFILSSNSSFRDWASAMEASRSFPSLSSCWYCSCSDDTNTKWLHCDEGTRNLLFCLIYWPYDALSKPGFPPEFPLTATSFPEQKRTPTTEGNHRQWHLLNQGCQTHFSPIRNLKFQHNLKTQKL